MMDDAFVIVTGGCLLVRDLLSNGKDLQTYWQRKMRPKVWFMLLVSFQFRRVSGGTESEDFALPGHGPRGSHLISLLLKKIFL